MDRAGRTDRGEGGPAGSVLSYSGGAEKWDPTRDVRFCWVLLGSRSDLQVW